MIRIVFVVASSSGVDYADIYCSIFVTLLLRGKGRPLDPGVERLVILVVIGYTDGDLVDILQSKHALVIRRLGCPLCGFEGGAH